MENHKQIRAAILRILQSGGFIKTRHVREQMIKRNFTDQDIAYVLKNGKITNASEEKGQGLSVEVEGEDLDGEALTLQIVLDVDAERIIVKTGHAPRHRSNK